MKNKVAVVTGASRGIGKAIAIELAKNNIDVVINYTKNEVAAEKTLSEVKKYADGICIKADVSNQNEVAEMKNIVKERFGQVDILVNNAGVIVRPGDWKNISNESFNRTLDVNLKGCFNCIKEFSSLISTSKEGRIVNLSSTCGKSGVTAVVAYSAAKAGVINLTNQFAKELAPNVTVNAVAPGNIDTDMTREAGDNLIDYVINETPCKRLGTAEEVANLVSFLVSDKAAFITGQVIDIDGGYNLR